jgi:hypothetical protein
MAPKSPKVRHFRVLLFLGCIASQLLVVIFLESTKWSRNSNSQVSPLDRSRMVSMKFDMSTPLDFNATLFAANFSNLSSPGSAFGTANPPPALILAVPPSEIEILPAISPVLAPHDTQATKDAPLAAVEAAGSAGEPVPVLKSDRPILLFCIPSATRANDSYLSLVLGSIEAEIQRSQGIAPAPMRVEVLVIDVTPAAVRADIRGARARFPAFAFEPLANKTWEECTPEQLLTDSGAPGQPPCSVRQQTRDVTAALAQCAARVPADGWVAFVEDDTEMCAGALRPMAALRALGRWRFVAFSNYFSGTAFAQPAAGAFARHAAGRRGEKPIDHLVWDPWAPGQYLETGGNLFAHRGRVSVFQYRNTAAFRELYDGMRFSGRQSDCALPASPEIENAIASAVANAT